MLVGVTTRQYARSLEPLPTGVSSRGTSKSSVSRRFIARTTAQLHAWQTAPLDGLDLVALLLDGVHRGPLPHRRARDRRRRAETRAGTLGGATENATVCRSLLANLQGRGLRTDRSLLVILDGALALHKAVRTVFGEAALISGAKSISCGTSSIICRSAKRPSVQELVRRAYLAPDVKTATRLLTDLRRAWSRSIRVRPAACARASRKLGRGDPSALRAQRSLATTNAVKSLSQSHAPCESET